MTSDLLKLFALDAEDLRVVSAHVQDAVARVAEIRWTPGGGQFSIPMNRFAWELATRHPRHRDGNERRRSVLHFNRVSRARVSGLATTGPEQVVAVLAVLFEPGTAPDAPAGIVSVVCSGDIVVHLDVECIEAQLTDVGAAWSASIRPKHALGRP